VNALVIPLVVQTGAKETEYEAFKNIETKKQEFQDLKKLK
jgi:hypothetical protein